MVNKLETDDWFNLVLNIHWSIFFLLFMVLNSKFLLTNHPNNDQKSHVILGFSVYVWTNFSLLSVIKWLIVKLWVFVFQDFQWHLADSGDSAKGFTWEGRRDRTPRGRWWSSGRTRVTWCTSSRASSLAPWHSPPSELT